MSRFCSDEGRSGNTGLHPNHSTSRLILPGPTLLAHIYMHRTCAETDRQNQRQTHSRVSYRRQPSGIGFCCEKSCMLYSGHVLTGINPCTLEDRPNMPPCLKKLCTSNHGATEKTAARRQPLPAPKSENFAKCIQQSMNAEPRSA